MRKDDSSLSHDERAFVEARAKMLLERADAWGVVPVPIDDLLSAAKLKVAPTSLFDPRAIAAYAMTQGKKAADVVKLTEAKTVQGQSVKIAVKDGKVSVDGANVTATDIAASNGVIHVIDSVILPK